jgi:hypothetical protein
MATRERRRLVTTWLPQSGPSVRRGWPAAPNIWLPVGQRNSLPETKSLAKQKAIERRALLDPLSYPAGPDAGPGFDHPETPGH